MKPRLVAIWMVCVFCVSLAYAQGPDVRSQVEQTAYQKRFGTTSHIPETALALPVLVQEVEGLEVRNGRGERLGTVDHVIRSGQTTYLIVAHQRFLGVADGKVAFPVKRFSLGAHGYLIVRGVTKHDVTQMDRWRDPDFLRRRSDGHELIFLTTVR